MKWSKEQLQAIESINTNELLNAGAGSGKTAVLSEHVIFLLEHGYDLKDLLIMTFTNPAANEMKQRIKQKIESKPELNAKYGDEIEAAHIQTFDAFYLYLVNKYYYVFNLDNKISIFDSNIENILITRVIKQILQRYYESDDALFKNIVKKTCIKDDGFLYSVIKEILHQADLSLDKDEFFNNYLDKFFTQNYIEKLIDFRYQEMKDILSNLKDACEKLENDKDRENLIDFINSFDQCQSYDELYYKTINASFPKKIGGKSSDKAYRDKLKKIFETNFSLNNVDYGYAKDIKEVQESIKPTCQLLFDLAKQVETNIQEFKHKFNSFTFSDVSKMALKLMDIPEILKEVRHEFKYILIDEYQDTNDIQEEFVKKLENNNVFMVGDVKQSIYRFRNANCMIFQDKYNLYKHGGHGGHAIDMTNNFRSRRELVDGFNEYFNQLMDKRYNLIDYSDGHFTNFGFKDYDENISSEQHNGIQIFNYSKSCLKQDDKKYSTSEYEARIIANDIINKINNGYKVYDKDRDDNKLRNCMFKDFAIIINQGTHFDEFKRVFSEYSIPLFVYNDEDLRGNLIFMLGPNLLKIYRGVKNRVFDNEFIHAFISMSRSFILQRNDEEIYKTVKSQNFDCDELVIAFKEIINEHDQKPVSEIFNEILVKFDVFYKLTNIGDYLYNSAYLQSFINLIKSMDKFNFSIDEVIEYFKDLDEAQIEIKANPIKESENSVILLNIHKSKGLEYPIVYYPSMTTAFNRRGLSDPIIISKKFGPILPDSMSKHMQLARRLNAKEEAQQDYEERLRLFYVALTRAKESAIIVDQYVEDELALMSPNDATSFHQMLSTLVFGNDPHVDKSNASFNNELNILQDKDGLTNFTLKELPAIDTHEISKTRASKIAGDDIDQDALDFGNKMHLLLELCDMDSKDLSYIKSAHERRYVQNVINLDIFKGIDSEHIRHEFAFYDDKNNLLGIIDCLLIKDNEIDIIDFKLKNIDDAAYKKQLKSYFNYIKTISSKKIKTFLISIIDGKIEEVKMDE